MRHPAWFAACAALLALPAFAAPPDGGHALPADGAMDQVSEAQDRRMVEKVAANIERLRAEGRLPEGVAPKVGGLAWPLGPVPGPGVDWHGISGFVDLNLAWPNQIRDYTCGTRTYDTSAGYNHRGTDYFIWPFPWHLMDTAPVDIRAAAPGTLIEKQDGYNDRSCNWDGPDTANYVIILHADGTIARYLHMKRGSVTPLPIGTQVAAGQVLGKVGSSGISTGPHLHFEVRASNNVNAPTVEPHQGACNASSSTWAQQRPYRDPAINRISTHSGAPVFPNCPSTVDQPKFKDTFQPGDPISFLAAYRDIGRGMLSEFRVLRPDGSEFASWTFDMAEDPGAPAYYNGAYWYWNNALPANAPAGLWTYEARFQGQVERHVFRVGSAVNAIADTRGLMGAWFEPATSGQGIEVLWINGETLLVFFYGHQDDGGNIFLLGQRTGPFDYGQPLVLEMRATTGGRFNQFDAGAIQRPVWGSLTLTFENCERALAELAGADGNKVMVLERLGRTEGLGCD